jgi:PAS domain S-box-containing protein
VIRFAVERQKFMEQERGSVVELWRQTEQVQVLTRQLREHRERLDFLLRGTVAIFWDWNLLSDRTTFSGHVSEILGFDCDEWNWSGGSWQSLIAQPERAEVTQRVERYLQSGNGDYEDLFRLRSADGTVRSIFARGRIIERTDYDTPIRMIGTFQDIADVTSIRSRQHESLRPGAVHRAAHAR